MLEALLLACAAGLTRTLTDAIHPQAHRLQIDPLGVSISGISSGADMAAQFQVAFSSIIAGSGIFAGQAPHCAVHYFPGEELYNASNPSVPFCDGCPKNRTIGYDHCKKHPDIALDVEPLIQHTEHQSSIGTIDNVTNLEDRRIFLYRGTNDHVYNKGAVNSTANFFRHFVKDSKQVFFESTVDSEHLLPTTNEWLCKWEEFKGCNYDGAGAALKFIYGGLPHGRSNASQSELDKHLSTFDQRPFHQPGAGFANSSAIFVPPACRKGKCKLHMFLHGCGGAMCFAPFSQHGGFNEWALTNNGADATTAQERSACYDGYGQTGRDYDLRNGAQMQVQVLRAMIRAVAGI